MRQFIIHTTRAAVVLGLVLSTAGCGSGDTPTKAGGQSPPITLKAISPAGSGFPGGDQLAEFARQVGQLSKGSITIDIAPPMNASNANNEMTAVQMVKNGEADLGLVPTRIFDVAGVDSFRALQTPFLISTNEIADKVLLDPIADEMLGGLSKAGLTGLALTFDSLRQPVGMTAPFLTPADFQGATFQTAESKTQELVFTALGSTVTHVSGGDLQAGLTDGTIKGQENSMQIPVKPLPGIITGNAVVYLKANAVFINSKVFDGLDKNQQATLKAAGSATRDWATRQHPDLVNSAAAYCAGGHGSVAVATPDQLQALRAAAQPAVAQLRADAFTSKAIDRITAIAGTEAATPAISPCTGASITPPGSTTTVVAASAGTTASAADGPVVPAGDQTVIDGVWRMTVSLDPNANRPNAARDATLNNGVWTFTFGHGRFSAADPGSTNSGTFAINGNRVSMIEPNGNRWEFTFERHGDTMTWGYAPGGTDNTESLWMDFVKNGLHRVGDAP